MNADAFVYICPCSAVKQVIRGWGTEWRVWNKQGNKDGRIIGSADSLGGDYEFTLVQAYQKHDLQLPGWSNSVGSIQGWFCQADTIYDLVYTT